MYRLTSKLIIYSNLGEDCILYRLSDICRRFEEKSSSKEELVRDTLTEIHRLLDVATTYGFNKNLWHNYLAFLLAMTETPFTLVSEKVGANKGSVNQFAKNDLAVFKELFDYDFTPMEKELGLNCFSIIENFTAVEKKEQIFNKSVSEKVQELSDAIEQAKDANGVYRAVTGFYKKYGVGKFGLNKAFRISNDPDLELLEPISHTSDARLEDLIGYDMQKKALMQNTEAFLQGKNANNVLLYGDAGTGKSMSIKAILNRYYGDGLRMIEIYKHQFKELPRVIAQIKNRNYRFILYMDDLSFEETELEYKYLKAIIEGGLEPKPENVLIYATSNRRHLIRETWSDRYDASQDDMHRNDTEQEKLSLANRFGISIGYFRPDRDEYMKIVTGLLKRRPEIRITPKEIREEAQKWQMNHGFLSGRSAEQFVNYLAGTWKKKK